MYKISKVNRENKFLFKSYFLDCVYKNMMIRSPMITLEKIFQS